MSSGLQLIGIVDTVLVDELRNITKIDYKDGECNRQKVIFGKKHDIKQGMEIYFDSHEGNFRFINPNEKDSKEINLTRMQKRTRENVGKVSGTTHTHSFEFIVDKNKDNKVLELGFVIVDYMRKPLLGQVVKIRRKGGFNIASVRVLGIPSKGKLEIPRTPINDSTSVYIATEDDVQLLLDMNEQDMYLGKIYKTDMKVYCNVTDLVAFNCMIFGQRGYGKTYTLSVIIEEVLKKGVPVIMIDPLGVCDFSVPNDVNNEVEDGKKLFNITPTGFGNFQTIYSFDSCCTKANAILKIEHLKKQKFYTDYLIKKGHISIINLVGSMSANERKNIVAEITENLFELRKNNVIPFYVQGIDELHLFAPESKYKDKCLSAVTNLATMGRTYGCGLIGTTQRPALVAKNIIAVSGNFVVNRVGWDNDKKVIKSSVMDAEKYINVIEALPIGVSYFSGLTKVPLIVDVRTRESKHFGDTVDLDHQSYEYEERKVKDIQEDIDNLL